MQRYFSIISFFVLFSSISIVCAQNKITGELNSIGKNIEQSLMNNNPSYFNSILDKQVLLKKVLINSKNSQVVNFNLGFQNGFYQSFDLGSMLLSQLNTNGSYDFLKTYEKSGHHVLLFRSFSNDGLNYHEFYIDKKDDRLIITDMYVYMTGELISERLRRTYIANLYKILPEEADFYVENDKYRTYKILEKAQKLAENGNHKKAFKTWSKIPYDRKKEKTVQLTGIQIASFYNIDLYNQLSRKYESEYPQDPGFYLFSLNGLYDQNAFDQSLSCLDSLDNLVGCDPMLDYIRAEIFSRMGNEQETIVAYERLIHSMPAFEPGYLEFFEFYMSRNDYENALSVLDRMSFEFNYYKEDFQDFLQKYPSLIKSELYAKWLTN